MSFVVDRDPRPRPPGAGRGDRPPSSRRMNHVMFGGLTHEPAARLAQLLVQITPDGLDTVFFSDSGSVSVEVAVKMALQYWRSIGRPDKHRLMTWRGGYHGDTFTPMSVCDPDGGMHSLWTDVLAASGVRAAGARRIRPRLQRGVREAAGRARRRTGRGDRRTRRAGRGRHAVPRPAVSAPTCATICDRHDVLLIFDEIATGFGRTGELFAADHARRQPRHHVRRQGADRWLHHAGRDAVHAATSRTPSARTSPAR